MITIEKENTVFFDVDDTLVLTKTPPPGSNYKMISVWDTVEVRHINLYAHAPMIRLLKEEHHRGSYIVVWSRGGYEWARSVVTALGLTDKVNLVMTKPIAYYDDIPIEQWLKHRIYMEPGQVYKP